MISNCFTRHIQGNVVGLVVLRVVVVVSAWKMRNRKSGRRQQNTLRDARFRIARESRVSRLNRGERQQRAVGRGVTGKTIILQVLDASLQLTSSLLNISFCIDGFWCPHSCAMVWMNLIPGHALHEKCLQRQGVGPLVRGQEQRALLVPRTNSG